MYDASKTQQQFQDIFQAVKELGLQDLVVLSSYDTTGNILLRQQAKHFTIALDTFTPNDYLQLKDQPYKYFMLPLASWTGNITADVRSWKKNVVTYTVNTAADMQKAYDLGIRIILTDNIPMIIEWMKAYDAKKAKK